MSKQHTSVRAYGILVDDGKVLLVRSSSPRSSRHCGGCPVVASTLASRPRRRCCANFTKRPVSTLPNQNCSTW